MATKSVIVSRTLRLAKRLMSERLPLPEATEGKFHIVNEVSAPGTKLMAVGMRESMYTGLPMCDLALPKPTVIHKLTNDDDGTWMSDLPCELLQMHRELAVRARGRVLIGGLGLGIVARMCETRKSVSHITVVERSPEVIKLVGPYLQPNTEIVCGDIHEYAAHVKPKEFDVALLDTWQGDGEMVWVFDVVPLRRTIGSKIKRVYCWHEHVMLGQVYSALFRVASIPSERLKSSGTKHYYAFRRAVEQEIDLPAVEIGDFTAMFEAEEANRKNAIVELFAHIFCKAVGSTDWENTFGRHWDELARTKICAA